MPRPPLAVYGTTYAADGEEFAVHYVVEEAIPGDRVSPAEPARARAIDATHEDGRPVSDGWWSAHEDGLNEVCRRSMERIDYPQEADGD